ncbi:collagen binding domain-containing protein [Streptomyces sp. NPDC059740]|uniref:MSCRAMM family protein n=1 Tax=Streptomyces sp. NPDC059740 TaxID=3346926 RepID=UPI003664DB72
MPGGAVPENNGANDTDGHPGQAPGDDRSAAGDHPTHRRDLGAGHPAPEGVGPAAGVGSGASAVGAGSGAAGGAAVGAAAVGRFGATGIRGRVLADGGAPVARAVVTLIDAGGGQLGRTSAEPDGTYLLQPPDRGTYVLVGSAPGHRPQVATVTVDHEPVEQDLVLTAAGGLTGTVHSGGVPVPEALVVATDERGEVTQSTTTEVNGAYQLAALAPGYYTLTVSAPGHQPSAEAVSVSEAAPTHHDVALAPAATVRGTIRDRRGRPLPDAQVTLLDRSGTVVGRHLTGEDGAYAFGDLAAGDYTVVASGYPPVTNPLSVVGQGGDGYDFTLSHEEQPPGA